MAWRTSNSTTLHVPLRTANQLPYNNRMNLYYLPHANVRKGGEVVWGAGPGEGGTPSTPINPADLSK